MHIRPSLPIVCLVLHVCGSVWLVLEINDYFLFYYSTIHSLKYPIIVSLTSVIPQTKSYFSQFSSICILNSCISLKFLCWIRTNNYNNGYDKWLLQDFDSNNLHLFLVGFPVKLVGLYFLCTK